MELDSRFEEFVENVRTLWPTAKINEAQLLAASRWKSWLSKFSDKAIMRMLVEHRASDPDATKPIWKTIFGKLAESSEMGDDVNRFEKLLVDIRDATMRYKPDSGANNWTDEELFTAFLKAEFFMGIPGGFARKWRAYLTESGFAVPPWLHRYADPQGYVEWVQLADVMGVKVPAHIRELASKWDRKAEMVA